MTTINTIEDLIQLLDEKPEWVEALRVRLLSRELIELPQLFAEFVEWTKQQFEEVNRQFEGVNRQFEEVNSRFDGVNEHIEGLYAIAERQDRRMGRMENDIEILKGFHASDVTRVLASIIAREMGFRGAVEVSREDLADMTTYGDTSDLSMGDLSSFMRADLVMTVTDENGEKWYIAVEASFTVDERDTRRALRNAGLLTRFTGAPAKAAVSGQALDRRVLDVIESGEVFWFQLDPESMLPDE